MSGGKKMTADEQSRQDAEYLLKFPAFRRFLWRVSQRARIFQSAADGQRDDLLKIEGRRSLGLEILEMVDEGQPVSHPDGPFLTIMQIIREEAIQQQEPTDDNSTRKDRYDRTAELDEPDDGDGD